MRATAAMPSRLCRTQGLKGVILTMDPLAEYRNGNGTFIDIGVRQDGQVQISRLADDFVRDPGEEVKVNQKVKVRVLDVDIPRKRPPALSTCRKRN